MQFQRQPSRFAALLADVVMSPMPGTELAARVHAVRPELPLVFMTGYTQTELLAGGLEAEHEVLLTTRFERETLLAAVREALGKAGDPGAPAGRQ